MIYTRSIKTCAEKVLKLEELVRSRASFVDNLHNAAVYEMKERAVTLAKAVLLMLPVVDTAKNVDETLQTLFSSGAIPDLHRALRDLDGGERK